MHFSIRQAGFAGAFALLAALAAASGPATAQQTQQQGAQKPVIGACMGCLHKYTQADVMALLKDEGYGSVRPGKKGLVLFKADGATMGVKVTKSHSLVYLFVHGKMPLPLKAANTWNLKSIYSKAVVSPKGTNILRATLPGGGGLSKKTVAVMTKLFSRFLAPQFVKFYREQMAAAKN